jgi:AcrR family transcriptional regulator
MVNKGKKYYDIVTTAKDLFWKHGIKRVTVEEICMIANVSKMTFYKYFPNKEELAKQIIKNIFDESMEKYNEMMLSDLPFSEKMKLQVKMKLEGTKDISEEYVKDVYEDTDSELHKYWEKRANEAIETVINYFKDAQAKGWLRKDIKIDFILYMINKFFDFANDDYLISKYDTMQDLIVEINKFFLYGILPYENKPDE